MGFGLKTLYVQELVEHMLQLEMEILQLKQLGVNLFRYKASAFALSSFYAGVGGAMAFTISGGVEPGSFNLFFLIFVAIIIIGGAGTVLGPLFGAFFFIMAPGFIQYILKITHF